MHTTTTAEEPAGILVVDDEPLLRWALRSRLEEAGYRVMEVGTGRQAMNFSRQGVDLVLLDLNLPDADGIELLRLLKERCPDCKVIVMTALLTPEIAEKARGYGACRYLEKPFNLDDMAQAVQQALRGGQAAMQHGP